MYRSVLANAVSLLLVPLLFFLAIAVTRAATGRELPTSKLWLTVKAALIGILLTGFARYVRLPYEIVPYFQEIQGLLVLFCWANLVAYLLADLYLHYRMEGQVPTFLRELAMLAVYLFAGATALRVIFDINMASILTTTTVLTAALAFAMQTSLANVVSGFHIQADRNFRSGTWLWLKDRDISGEVVNVGFRYSTILTTEEHQVHIPHHFLTQNVVHAIGNREDGPAGINLKVLLDYSFPPERAKPVLLKALQDEPGIMREPAPSVRLDSFLDSGIQYNLRFYLEDYGTILNARDGILERIWYAVAREGQTFPYPHREVLRKEPAVPFRMDAAAIRENLRGIEIFSPLGEEDLGALVPHVRLRVYGRGEAVVHEGEEGDSLFVVLSGDLEVEVNRRKVGSLSSGEFFGEMSLLTGEKRRATVRAAGEVRLLEISKAALEPVIRNHPSVVEGLTTSLEHRLEKIMTSQQVRVEAAEAPTLHEAILRKLKRFFGID